MVSQEKVTVIAVREALASLPGSRECADGLPPDCGFRECLHVAFWRGLKTASRRTGVPVEELEGWLWCKCVESPERIITAWESAGMSGLVKRMEYFVTWDGRHGYPDRMRFGREIPTGLGWGEQDAVEEAA